MSAAVFIYIYDHTPSGQSRLYRVTQLRTDGVHCRKSVVSTHKSLLYCCCTYYGPVFPPDLCLYSVEILVYTVQYHMLCFKTYRGTMYYCCTLWTGFYLPDLCLSMCKEFIVRYNIICCVSKHSYYYCAVFVDSFPPPPTFVRTRNSLYVHCIKNHIKTSMLIVGKKGVLYILKLVC